MTWCIGAAWAGLCWSVFTWLQQAGEYVRWIVNAKIDSTDADQDREHNCQTQKIDLKPKGLMQTGEKSAQRQIGDRRKCYMSAGEARGEHARRMRYKIGSGTLIG